MNNKKRVLWAWCKPMLILVLSAFLMLPGMAQAAKTPTEQATKTSTAQVAKTSCNPWIALPAPGTHTPTGYAAGICVSYQGQNYRTQWWADGKTPPFIGANPWDSPWILVSGPIPTPAPGKPVIPAIPDSTTGNVTLNWSFNVTEQAPKGTSWSVLDNFNGNTTTIHTSTTFGPTDPPTQQTGTAALTSLAAGTHQLTVRLCNGSGTSTVCTNSDVRSVNILVPPQPAPGKPVIPAIPDSTTGNVTLNWSFNVTEQAPKGTSWSVLDNFNGNTTTIHTSTTFGPTDPPTQQTGTAALTSLATGTHQLTVRLCKGSGTSTVCTNSDARSVNIVTPPQPIPGAPVVPQIPNSTNGKLVFNWTMTNGNPGTHWELWNGTTRMQSSTTFTDQTPNSQAGSVNLSVSSGTYVVKVKLCNSSNVCTDSNTQTVTVSNNSGLCTAWVARVYAADELGVCVSYQGQNYLNRWWAGPTDIPYTAVPDDYKSPWVATSGPPPAPPAKPVVSVPATSPTKEVALNWLANITEGASKGTSWSVLDTFNGNTTTIHNSTTFGPSDPADKQTGTAALTLDKGMHQLTVRLCKGTGASAVCTNSDVKPVNIELPPQSTPGTPVVPQIPNSTNGKLVFNWTMTNGHPGTYWKLLNGTTLMQRSTSFTGQTPDSQAGKVDLSVSNGTYVVKVQLCNDDNVCTDSNTQTVTVSGAPEKNAFFMAYYPTWFAPFHNAFCLSNGTYYDYATQSWKSCTVGTPIPDYSIEKSALLAGGIPDYVTHVVLSFGKLNAMHNYTGLSNADCPINTPCDLQLVGLSMVTKSASLKESIRVLKQKNPGTKVLLALGGATYNDSWQNVTPEDIAGLTNLIVDLDLDGLDVDYEKGGTSTDIINEYYNSIVHMRKAVDDASSQSGRDIILTLAGWSTGADCTAQTQGPNYPDCAGKLSFWGGNAGRERLVLQGKGAASMIDAIGIMSYDADYQHFDPVVAYEEYRAIAKPSAKVAIGIQPSPDEGWGAARTMVADIPGGACTGNLILEDQYGKKEPGTFSVERFAKALNSGDGMMMWSLFASRSSTPCGSGNISTVTEMGRGVSEYLSIGSDRTTMIDYATAIAYGRR